MLLMRNGIVGALYFMTFTDEAAFCIIFGGHDNDEEHLGVLLQVRMPPHPPPAPPVAHATKRSTEEELRKAAGGKCHDTFLQAVQGWT